MFGYCDSLLFSSLSSLFYLILCIICNLHGYDGRFYFFPSNTCQYSKVITVLDDRQFLRFILSSSFVFLVNYAENNNIVKKDVSRTEYTHTYYDRSLYCTVQYLCTSFTACLCNCVPCHREVSVYVRMDAERSIHRPILG